MTETRDLDPEEWELWGAWTRAQRLLAQELDRALQRDFGISKAEFSVLMTLWRAAGRELRVGELSESLGWEKSRVSHQLTRMEKRGFVARTESGAHGRRTGTRLTAEGRSAVESAITGHAGNIRRHFFDPLTPQQADAIRAWSEQTIERLEAHGDVSA
ncbi:MarR family transcriptional regulator [Streptomyces javensis]|uniref:MarR family winged helix-turn-helix transcriptional regulator n=1 Tax=Streptomyces javensis TaxID=114698 RepID=UPI0033D56D35